MSGLQPRGRNRRPRCSPRWLLHVSRRGYSRSLLGLLVCVPLPGAAASSAAAGAHRSRLSPGVDAPGSPVGSRPTGAAAADHNQTEQAVVISSYALVSVITRGPESFDKTVLPSLSSGLRGALADALEVCRPFVSMRSVHRASYGWDESLLAVGQRTGASEVMRRATADGLHPVTKFSQVEAVYEIRIEDALGLSEVEVANRVDSLQLYSRFADLNSLLRRWLDSNPAPQGVLEIAFSDLGYANRRVEHRPPLSNEQAGACVEEGLLRDAKASHQYVVVAALVMSVMIACIGSLAFAVKAPSHIPSRMNPLTMHSGQ